jgi:hypothetical protein
MENAGKSWTIEEDKVLLDAAKDDGELSAVLKRGLWAVKYRRAHLAVLLFKNSTEALDACCRLVRADQRLAHKLVEEQKILVALVVNKWKAREMPTNKEEDEMDKEDSNANDVDMIREICKNIDHECVRRTSCVCHAYKRKHGDERIWWDDMLTPWAIKYYAGLKAYEQHVERSRY